MSTDRDLVKAGACLGVGFLISFIFPPAFFIGAMGAAFFGGRKAISVGRAEGDSESNLDWEIGAACIAAGFITSFFFPPAAILGLLAGGYFAVQKIARHYPLSPSKEGQPAPKAEVEAEDVVSDKTDKPHDSHNSLGFGAFSSIFNRGKKEEGPSHSGSEQDRPHKSTDDKSSKP